MIANVKIQEKNILISVYKPQWGVVYTEKTMKEIFGYKIIFDTTNSYEEYKHKSKGIKE